MIQTDFFDEFIPIADEYHLAPIAGLRSAG